MNEVIQFHFNLNIILILAIYLHNTGIFKYYLKLKDPKIKITFVNEDNGKQIGDVLWSKKGTFNKDY